MLKQDSWLLPEGIEEIFPDEAETLDRLGRLLIDRFSTWGYRLVMPPVIDFLDSLLVGAGHELDAQTLKLADPVSGRLIGLRADMTPQVARIDARTARSDLPTRLCYAGSVIHALAGHLEKSRNPIQIGAELYGQGGVAAVAEVIRLMLDALQQAGVAKVHLDLGHVGVYRALAESAGLTPAQEASLFDILQRKDTTELDQLLRTIGVVDPSASMIRALLDLNGPGEVMQTARAQLQAADSRVFSALDELDTIVDIVRRRYPDIPLNLDLAELRGYKYHTGVVFAAFVPGQGREIARGGRYDEIGRAFGHPRPAVGFSADLKMLARLSRNLQEGSARQTIFAPAIEDPELDEAVLMLRDQGMIVIQSLGNNGDTASQQACQQTLCKIEGRWQLV